MASNHDSELTKNLLNCPWGAHFADEFNLNIVEENGFSPSSESSFELEKSSRQQLFQLSPYIDECVLVKCKLKICRKFVKAQHFMSHVTDYHRLSVEEYKQITNLDGHSKTTNNLDDEDDLIKMLNNFESDKIKINSETDQFKTKNYNHDINIFRNYEKNCINSNGIVPLSRFVDNRKRPLVYSRQSTAKKKVKLNPDQEHRWVRIRSPPAMAGIIQAQRQQGLTYPIIRKFRKSPVASMQGSLQLQRHRLVYPSYRIQQKQMLDVIKHRNSFFQNADGARRSSASSSKNKTPVHPIHLFTREAKPSDNHNLESISNPLTYSKILCYRRENCRRNSSSDKLNTSPPHYLSTKVPDEKVIENIECPILRMKSLDLQRPRTAEPDDACSSSTSSSNVITDEDRSSSLEERRQSEEDVTSDSDAKSSSDDETSRTSSSPSEDEQDQEKGVSFLDRREEHPEFFSKEKCFSGPNSDSPTPKECEIESVNFLGVKKGSSSSDCSSAESSVEDSENEDLSNEDDDEEEEMSEDDDDDQEVEKELSGEDDDEVGKEEISDEENEVKKEEITNKEDEMENKHVLNKDLEMSDEESDEEEEMFKDYNDNWWDRRSSLTSAGSNMSINWCKNSKFNLVSFKSPPSKFDGIQSVNNIKLKITHKSNMSNKSVGTMLSEKVESNFDFEGIVLVPRATSLGIDKSTDNPEEDLKPDDHRNISPTPKNSSENSVKNSAASITPNKEQPDLAKYRNSNSNPSVSTTPVESQPQKKLNTDKSDSTSVINRKFSLKNNYLKFNRPRTFSFLKQQDKSRDEMLRKVKLPDADKEPFKQPILSPISFPNQSAIQQTLVPKPNNIHTVQAVKALVRTTNGDINKCDKIANLVTRKHPQVNGIKLNENHLKPEYINAIVSSCIDGRKHLKGDSCRSEAESDIILGIKKGPFIDPSLSSTKLPLENSFSKIRKDSSNVTIHNDDNKDKQYLNSGPVIQNGY